MKATDLMNTLAATLEPIIKQAMDEALPKALAGIKEIPSKPEEEGYIFLSEACELTNLSRSTIYIKSCKNEIPVIRKGGRLYFKRSELLEWIRTGKR